MHPCSALGGSGELLCEDVPVTSPGVPARCLAVLGTALGPLLWVSLCHRCRAAQQRCLPADLAHQREGKYSLWPDTLPALLTARSLHLGAASPWPALLQFAKIWDLALVLSSSSAQAPPGQLLGLRGAVGTPESAELVEAGTEERTCHGCMFIYDPFSSLL